MIGRSQVGFPLAANHEQVHFHKEVKEASVPVSGIRLAGKAEMSLNVALNSYKMYYEC